jgi:long-chain fatty acid transport protein
LIDVDFRYFDYANTPLFGQSVIDGGLGWRSVFAVATGAQYQVNDRVTIRGGYLFSTDPIHDTATLFNVQAPGHYPEYAHDGLIGKIKRECDTLAGLDARIP